MSEGFEVEFRKDHVHVVIGEGYQPEAGNQNDFWQQVKSLCEAHGTRRVLVEGVVPKGERNTKDVIDAGLRTATVPHLWMAFCLKDFEPSDRSELFEAIAVSRGVRVKFFADQERALHWLTVNAE